MTQIEICFNSFNTEIDRLGLAGDRWVEIRRPMLTDTLPYYTFRVIGRPFKAGDRCKGWAWKIRGEDLLLRNDCADFGVTLGNMFNDDAQRNQLR